MFRRFVGAAALIAAVIMPLAAQSQGIQGGAAQGAREGGQAAGPVGAAVGGVIGGAIGGVVGGVKGILGIDQRPRFHSYVVERRHPSYQYREELSVGTVLPESDITYYEVPREYGAPEYRYTVVNGRTVLVDPRTRRIVEFVD